MLSDFIQGEKVDNIVRLKPPINFQKEDVRFNNKQIILTDSNNRILDEFQVDKAFDEKHSLLSIYENELARYLTPFLQGININLIAYGSTGAGKTTLIEGNKKEFGVIMMYVSTLFTLLAQKRQQLNTDPNSKYHSYTCDVQAQFIEIIDEQVTDLSVINRNSDSLDIEDDVWEGPTIQGAQWLTINSDRQYLDALTQSIKNRNNTSTEFGKVSSKATALYYIRITQKSFLKENDEQIILRSIMSFFDLPGSEILIDDPETIRIKQGSTLNKAIIAMTQLMKDIAHSSTNKLDNILYDTSTVTTLNKEYLGGNALSIIFFCLQHGDHKGSAITLAALKNCMQIVNFPLINDGKSLAIQKRYRQEVRAQGRKGSRAPSGDVKYDGINQQKLLELERMQNDYQQQIFSLSDEKNRYSTRLAELRNKYQDLVKQKADLQAELIKSEEDKLEISKALVELQMENTQLVDAIQNEKYNQNNKLLNEDQDLLTNELREGVARDTIQQLQDKLREVIEEKREFELEFMVLKKNYLNVTQQLENERMKMEAFQLQIINITNENKALSEELNNYYKKSGSQTEEGAKLVQQIENLERSLREKDETLTFRQLEVEKLKAQLMKYKILEDRGKLDGDLKNLDLEKSQIVSQLKLSTLQAEKEPLQNEDRLHWESQKMELTHKVRALQRRVNDDQVKIQELNKEVAELRADHNQLQMSNDQMRAVYRNKLISLTTDSVKGKGPEVQAREEVFKSYQEREQQLQLQVAQLQRIVNTQKQDIKALQNQARNEQYKAEDIDAQQPVQQPPQIVTEKQFNPVQFQKETPNDFEMDKPKERNKRQEDNMKQAYEKLLRQSEKEKTDLLVRCTMAEEQLQQFQQNLARITLDYQKKITELKQQLNKRL